MIDPGQRGQIRAHVISTLGAPLASGPPYVRDYTIGGWHASTDPDVIAPRTLHDSDPAGGCAPQTSSVTLQLVRVAAN